MKNKLTNWYWTLIFMYPIIFLLTLIAFVGTPQFIPAISIVGGIWIVSMIFFAYTKHD